MRLGLRRLAGASYRAVLRLAPPRAFDGLEREMSEAFLAACEQSLQRHGVFGLLRAVVAGIGDGILQLGREWRDRLRPSRTDQLLADTAWRGTKPQGRSLRMGGWSRDIGQALRAARSRPGYAVAVMGTLAVVIGANTAVFSVLENVLLAPLPYASQDRLVQVYRSYPAFNLARGPISYPDFADWRAADVGLEDLAAYSEEEFTHLGLEGAERWDGVEVTTNLLPLLGVQPILGRLPDPSPDGLGTGTEIVLSYDAWARSFGLDSDVIGRTVSVDGISRVVIGVMPGSFQFPTEGVEFWTALPHHPYVSERTTGFLTAIGRRTQAVDEEIVTDRLATLSARIDEEVGRDMEMGVYVESLREAVVGDVSLLFLIAMGAVLFVFAIACANLTNLSLARGLARGHEFAVRSVLGAGRFALARQLTIESLSLSLMGGLAGVVLAWWLTRTFVALAPAGIPRVDQIEVNPFALAFTLAISVIGGVVIGVAPARGAMKADPAGALRGSGGATASFSGRRLQKGLVVAQVAMTTILLAGASLLLVSFQRLSSVDPGIQHDNVLAMRVALRDGESRDRRGSDQGSEEERYDEAASARSFYDELVRQALAVPGVADATISTSPPFSGTTRQMEITIEGRESVADELPPSRMARADAHYFSVLGLELVAGPGFDGSERPGEPRTAVINVTMSQLYWPEGDAVGRRFESGPHDAKTWNTVVGIVRDNRHRGLEEEPMPMFLLNRHQAPDFREAFLLVRGSQPVLPLTPALRAVITRLDPSIPVSDVSTLSSLISRTLTQPRFRATVLAGLAAMALTIAAVGIYAVLAFLVGQRRREIGIRLALGAPRDSVFLKVVGEGTALVGLGLAIGTAAAVALSRVLDAMLYGVSARDPLALIISSVFLITVGFLACAGPALRASRVDPQLTLRGD